MIDKTNHYSREGILATSINFEGRMGIKSELNNDPLQDGCFFVKKKELDNLYGELLYALPVFIVIAVAIDYYAAINQPNLLIFLGFIHFAQVLSCVVCFFYKKTHFDKYTIAFWNCFYMVILAICSAAWGGLGFVLINSVSSSIVVLVAISVVGVSLIGVYQNLINRNALLVWLMLFLGPTLIGLWTRKYDTGMIENPGITFVLLVIFVFAILKSKRCKSSFDDGVMNICLVEKLRKRKIISDFQSKEKSMFLAAVSHDLRQPIHALALFVSALNKGKIVGNDRCILENLNKCVDSLSRAFNAMLDVSKLDAGAVNPDVHLIEICDVFRRLHVNFVGQAECKGLQLRFKHGGKIVFSDSLLIERILGNLIQNAIKYTNSGGVLVLARGHGSTIRLEVWDTGEGIGHDQMPRIFDEFYQIKKQSPNDQGAGMGLAIVKRLALLLNHPLEAKSRLGRGSMFRIFVPKQAKSDIGAIKSSDSA